VSILIDFDRSSTESGFQIEMESCWRATIPVNKISLMRQEEYVDQDDGSYVLETYIHLSEAVQPNGIERVRLPNVKISDLQPFMPEGNCLHFLTDSDIDPNHVVPCLISKEHIHDVKDKNGLVVQINVADAVVTSLCLVPYQMSGEVSAELDKLFLMETDSYGWRKKRLVPA